MQNVYLKFYVTEKQRHNGKLLYEWLLEEAQKLGVPGASAFRAIAGFGRHGRLHEESFFELAGELPVQVEFILIRPWPINCWMAYGQTNSSCSMCVMRWKREYCSCPSCREINPFPDPSRKITVAL